MTDHFDTLWNKLRSQLDSRVAIIGIGKSGQSVFQLLKLCPYPWEKIDLYDDLSDGYPKWKDERIKDYSDLIISPGVPLKPFWKKSEEFPTIRLWNEIDIASFFLDEEIVYAITGSAGKSTVTSALAWCLKRSNYDDKVFAGGNLGTPLAIYAKLKIQGQIKSNYVCLELSSYQLENLKFLKPDWGIITSLFPNHLDRYQSLEHYYATKLSFLVLCKKGVIYNRGSNELREFIDRCIKNQDFLRNLWRTHESHIIQSHQKQTWAKLYSAQKSDFPHVDWAKARIFGSHNHDNLSLVMKLLNEEQIPYSTEKLLSYPGLPHRMENFGSFQGVTFINDSKATTIGSVIEAIQTTVPQTKKNLHILLGGKDKELDWERLQDLNRGANMKFYFFGDCGALAQIKSGIPGPCYPRLSHLLPVLIQNVEPGDVVLLSPGGTSLDEFRSFEERGEFFKKFVEKHFNKIK